MSSRTSQEQKLAGFRELFRENFDIPGLSRFVLGRFWRIFTPSEQQEFLGLFENFVVLTYSAGLLEYADGGGGLRVVSSRPRRCPTSPATTLSPQVLCGLSWAETSN